METPNAKLGYCALQRTHRKAVRFPPVCYIPNLRPEGGRTIMDARTPLQLKEGD